MVASLRSRAGEIGRWLVGWSLAAPEFAQSVAGSALQPAFAGVPLDPAPVQPRTPAPSPAPAPVIDARPQRLAASAAERPRGPVSARRALHPRPPLLNTLAPPGLNVGIPFRGPLSGAPPPAPPAQGTPAPAAAPAAGGAFHAWPAQAAVPVGGAFP